MGAWGVSIDPRRWTPLVFLFPNRYVAQGPFWVEFDLERWSRAEYEWTRDGWDGLRDFAARPAETVDRGRGDCEDYALVALSWAVAHDREAAGIAFCWESPYPWPRHVVAFDHERVYSSGEITRQTVDEWVADSSRYDFALERRLST
jgi:hypothetical protein